MEQNAGVAISRKAVVTQSVGGLIPPHAWFIISAAFHYIGPSFAVLLFPTVGMVGVACLRTTSAALLLALWSNPWRTFWANDGLARLDLIALGLCFGAMNTVFYFALNRLPMGLVAAIEFVGTLAVAAYGLRSIRNFFALVLCLSGAVLLINLKWKTDPLGLFWALLNGGLFVVYVALGYRISQRGASAGIQGLGVALAVAAIVTLPVGFFSFAPLWQRPPLILAGVGVGVCSSVIPYVCDQLAMARLPRASFALMRSLLPATAAILGAVILRQIPTGRDIVGILLVVTGVAAHCLPNSRDKRIPPISTKSG